MGMYTELYISAELKKDTPENVINVLKYLFNQEKYTDEPPDHAFFACKRWGNIGSSSSFYFTPLDLSKIEKIQGSYYFTSRSDLKNYDNEIENFLDFIMPYIDANEGDHLGHYRYEENQEPTLIYKTE